MIQLFAVAVQVLCVIALSWSAWNIVCNSATHKDIMTFLECVRHRPVTGPKLLAEFQKVTYRQHLRARVWRRDPWRLYDPMITEAMKNPRTEQIAGTVMLTIGPDGAVHGEDVEAETKH